MVDVLEKNVQWQHVEVRPFEPRDYEPIVEIDNLLFPEHRGTVEEARYDDKHFDRTRYFERRYVAEDPSTGRVVAYGSYEHMPWNFHPDKYGIWVAVHPESHRRGIGSTVYARIMADLNERRAIALRAWARETMGPSVAFLAHRGFVERMRNWESHLFVSDFDFTKFMDRWGPPPGIRIITLTEELRRDPESPRPVFDLMNAIMPDVPMPDRYTPGTYEMFLADIRGPDALPDAYFLAKEGERYVGISALFRSEEMKEHLFQGLTGVVRGSRGRGIAMALKLRTIAYARDHGYEKIRTWNNTENHAMLAINDRLGFVKQPAWIVFEKDLTAEARE